MNKKHFLACIASVLAPAVACAQPIVGPYVDLGGGVDLLQNENVRPSGAGPSPRHYSFDPGGAAVAALGYGLGNGFRVEAEGSYSYSHVHGVELPAVSTGMRAGGHEQQYGGFANVLYDVPLRFPVKPFFGLGAGYRDVDLGEINSSAYNTQSIHVGAQTRGNFAYQGIAGLAIPTPLPGLSFTLEYRLIGVLSPNPFYRETSRLLVSNSGPSQVIGNGEFINVKGTGFHEVDIREHATFDNIFNHEILVGLTYAFNTAPPPLPHAPVVPAAPLAEARTYLVFFDWDRSDLTSRAREIVAQAAQASTQVQTTRIEVNGYTDNSSIHGGARGASYNKSLSIRRANSVKAELIRNGVPGSALDIRGYGESHPLVASNPDAREPQNRRVEIILH